MLLYDGEKGCRGGFWLGKYHCFAAERSYLGSSDIEYVAEFCKFGQCQIAFGAGEAIAEPGSVNEEFHLIFPAYFPDGCNFRLAVERSVFAGKGYVNHRGIYHMLPGSVVVEALQPGLELACVDFALVPGQGDDLVSAEFYGPGFVYGYMSAFRGNHSFVPGKHGVNHRRISLRSSDKEKYLCRRLAYCRPNFLDGCGAEFVLAVSGGLYHIGPGEFLEYRRMCSFAIIAGE